MKGKDHKTVVIFKKIQCLQRVFFSQLLPPEFLFMQTSSWCFCGEYSTKKTQNKTKQRGWNETSVNINSDQTLDCFTPGTLWPCGR